MTNKPMTTQSELDELENLLATFGEPIVDRIGGPVVEYHIRGSKNWLALIAGLKRRELSLLAEVEKRVIGVKVFNHAACSINGKDHGESCVAQSKLQDKQRQTLQAMRSERNL